MPNFNIWIKDPYPFRWEETHAIATALQQVYGGKPVYLQEWPIHYVSVDDVNITTARSMASAVKFLHRQAALRDKQAGYYQSSGNPALHAEVELREMLAARPEWAKERIG